MHHCASPHPSSPPFLLFLFWLEIVLDYFNTFSLYPVGSQFQVGRITLVNTFPFSTKLQSHSPVKRSLDKKIVSRTLPHLTAHLPLNTPRLHFPLVSSPPFPPRLIPSRSFSIFCSVLSKCGWSSRGKPNPMWPVVGNRVIFEYCVNSLLLVSSAAVSIRRKTVRSMIEQCCRSRVKCTIEERLRLDGTQPYLC